MNPIAENIQDIQARIAAACQRSGRSPDSVQLIAVTKTIAVDQINLAIEAGMTILGENRVQEVLHKYESVSPDVSWHLIGHLQTNKVRQIIDRVTLIHSLDSLHLAKELQKRAEKRGKPVEVLIEVNVGQEVSKFGLSPEEVPAFLETLRDLDFIQVRGLMTVAPFLEDPEDVRIVFRRLKSLFDAIEALDIPNVTMVHLSMGMTHDFEVAIEEGATMVRVGTGIFGSRNYVVQEG